MKHLMIHAIKNETIISICAFRDRNRIRLPRRAHLEDLGL